MPLVFRMMLLKETVKVFCGYTRFLVDADDDDEMFFRCYSFLPCHLPVTKPFLAFLFFILPEDGYSIRFNSLRLHLINLYFRFKKKLVVRVDFIVRY